MAENVIILVGGIEMKKTIFTLVFLLITIMIYAKEVPANNRGIANASPGDYIIRSSGERVILKQADIDYARRQLGMTSTQNTQNRPVTTNSSSSTRTSTSSNSGSEYGGIIIFLLVVVGIIIVIGVSVSNITTTVAKNSGMNDEDAKKVGASAGVLAGTAAAIGAALLLGKSGGFKSNKKHYEITHKHQ